MIEYYESAVNVLVGFNKNLGNRGWQAAAHMMRKVGVSETIIVDLTRINAVRVAESKPEDRRALTVRTCSRKELFTSH